MSTASAIVDLVAWIVLGYVIASKVRIWCASRRAKNEAPSASLFTAAEAFARTEAKRRGIHYTDVTFSRDMDGHMDLQISFVEPRPNVWVSE